MENVIRRKWPVIVAAVLGVFIMGVISVIATLYFLSATPTGESIRSKLGLNNLKTFNIQTTTSSKVVVEESSAFIKASNDVSPAVVSITSGQLVNSFFGVQTATVAGTGFIVTSDGLIATNKHVVQGGSTFTITTFDGKSYDGKVVAQDPITDLALIKIDAHGLPVVELGDSDKVQVGQWVIAIGNALGEFQNTVTVGVISAKNRQANPTDAGGQTENLNGLFQTDAAINSGNSGGPLLTTASQVIGINTAIAGNGAQNIGFAIPSNELKKALDSYRANGKIIRPYLGISYQTVTSVIAKQLNLSTEQGALLYATNGQSSIVAGSAAAKAGLKDGDIITKVNSDSVTETTPLSQIIRQYNPGDKVTLTVMRGKDEIKLDLTLGSLGG